MYDKLLELIKKQKDFEKICKKLELKDYELYGLVEMLKNKGVNISIFNDDGTKKVLYYEKIIIPEDNEIKIETREKLIRLGIVSDTHACCHYQQMSLLNTAYKDFYNRKIKTVLHVGDLSDGDYRNRPDHLYSLFKIGASEQAEYIADMYPRVNSMQTYFLQGSHDDTHIKNGGADIGKMISSVRPDMINLGHGQAFFKINGVNIELLHPGGGSCFDDETEIMTKDGWKLFKHLIKSDYVATMTKDNNMFEWQQPREITNEKYDGANTMGTKLKKLKNASLLIDNEVIV